MPGRVSGPWSGATHLFRCLVWHRRRMGCALHPILPGGSLPIQKSRAGRPSNRVEPASTFAMLGPRPTSRASAVGGPARGPGCRDDDQAHRLAWSRTGATTPAPAAALADAGSLCVPIGSQSRREHKGCLQDRGRGFAASRGPADAVAAEGAIMALVQRRSRARHAADDLGLAGLGRGSTPAEGRAESVPEAGGTGADAAATPTTPPPVTTQTRPRNRRPRPAVTAGRRETCGTWPPGTFGQAEAGERPNRERCRSGGFPGGSKGGRATLASLAVIPWVCWLGHVSVAQASRRMPSKRAVETNSSRVVRVPCLE